MILNKCFKCGGERTLISRSIDRPDYASHTEDECLIALNQRISDAENKITRLLHMLDNMLANGANYGPR